MYYRANIHIKFSHGRNKNKNITAGSTRSIVICTVLSGPEKVMGEEAGNDVVGNFRHVLGSAGSNERRHF